MNLEGEKYKIETEARCFAHGGNGEIFRVKSIVPVHSEDEKPNPTELVIKILKNVFMKLYQGRRHKRYYRFVAEIDKVLEFQDTVPHVMKILDHSINNEDTRPWYLMRYAENFRSCCNEMDIISKIKYMINIGETLKKLHSKNIAHRDIKLENILFLNKEIYLSDFGLICSLEKPLHLTETNERLGPIFITPPELEENRDDKNIDYRKSDVYLFAKLVWSCLRNEPLAFRGTYVRIGTPYLSKGKLRNYPLEPIHIMLEECTKEDYNIRPDMDRCIDLLKEEIEILDNTNSKKAVDFRTMETDREIQNTYENQKKVFTDIETIIKIMEHKLRYFPLIFSFMGIASFIVESVHRSSEMGKSSMEHNLSTFIMLKTTNQNSYLCVPDSLEIDNLKEHYSYRLYIKNPMDSGILTRYIELSKPDDIIDKENSVKKNKFTLAFSGWIGFAGRDNWT